MRWNHVDVSMSNSITHRTTDIKDWVQAPIRFGFVCMNRVSQLMARTTIKASNINTLYNVNEKFKDFTL